MVLLWFRATVDRGRGNVSSAYLASSNLKQLIVVMPGRHRDSQPAIGSPDNHRVVEWGPCLRLTNGFEIGDAYARSSRRKEALNRPDPQKAIRASSPWLLKLSGFDTQAALMRHNGAVAQPMLRLTCGGGWTQEQTSAQAATPFDRRLVLPARLDWCCSLPANHRPKAR